MTAVVQPSGTVTLVFTDIEGSTRMLDELGIDAYREALGEHRRVVREACARHAGYEVDYEGDAFFYAFATAEAAVAAVSEAMAGLDGGPIKIRVGIHTGEPAVDPPKYVGMPVHLAARIMSTAHGGQVVLSAAAAEVLRGHGFELRDLGEHRLKDIAEPVSILQLGSRRFPPLKSVSNTNLPRPASPFVGRERELGELVESLRRRGVRLLSLTGPGGTGKTRLALEAAASVVPEYKAGVFWVGLAPLRDPALVTEAIAQTLGAKDTLAAHIADREMLLLLDNLEQVIDAAPDLSALVSACPNLTVLVTSRELLRVQGEREYPVAPLAEPDAVSLFCERSTLEASEQIAELCVRLDNLPLAVELAAARTKALSPAQILERLSSRLDLLTGSRDADPRQQTLRATVEWSYELLTADEQQLFRRLSVFAGGCTLHAAEEIAGADLDNLQSLVQKSLLRFSNERYWTLETIREFAAESLQRCGEAAQLRRRHADWFTELALETEPWLRAREQATALARLRAEHDNLRAALEFLGTGADRVGEARLAGTLWYFWYVAGYLEEGKQQLTAALARAAHAPPDMRAPLHDGLSTIEVVSGDPDEALRHAVESLRIRRSIDDPPGLLRSLLNRAIAAGNTGDLYTAEAMLDECAARSRALAERWFLSVSLGNLGVVARERGDLASSRSLVAEALELAEHVGDTMLAAGFMVNLSLVELRLGEYPPAEARIRRVLALLADHDLPEMLIWAFEGLAFLEADAGDPVRGARLLGVSESISESIAYTEPSNARWDAEIRSMLRNRLGDAAFTATLSDGRELSVAEGIEYALERGRRNAPTT